MRHTLEMTRLFLAAAPAYVLIGLSPSGWEGARRLDPSQG